MWPSLGDIILRIHYFSEPEKPYILASCHGNKSKTLSGGALCSADCVASLSGDVLRPGGRLAIMGAAEKELLKKSHVGVRPSADSTSNERTHLIVPGLVGFSPHCAFFCLL